MSEPLRNKMIREGDSIGFHHEQVAWLEKMFPEKIHSPNSTPAEMYFQAGVRTVIQTVKEKKRV